jgi:hypothetical protein
MYSPKIKEELIPYLYQESKSHKIPMTKYVNRIIENYLSETRKEYKRELLSETEQGDNADPLRQSKTRE